MKKKIKNENIEIETAITFLKKGKLILYPTDTVWGIGCDATSSKAIKNLYNLKKIDIDSSFPRYILENKDKLKK